MNTLLRTVAVVTVVGLGLMIGGCKKSDSSTGPGGGTTGGATLGQVLFTMDGTPYTGVGAAFRDTTNGQLTIGGTATVTGGQNVSCGIIFPSENFQTGTPISLNAGQPVYAGIVYGDPTNPTSIYTTAGTGGTGTITVTAKSTTAVSGTFSFTAVAAPPGTGQKVVTNGSFNLSIVTE